MTVFFGFAEIQNAHYFEVHLADFHGALKQCAHVSRPGSEPRHNFVVLRVDIVVVLAEHVSVFHIGRRTFQAVQTQQTQAKNIFANFCFIAVWCEFSRLAL
ncbi:hypothetical protein D3C75_948530 [compost metagenome]